MDVKITKGTAGATYQITGTGTAAGIASTVLDDANGRRAQAVVLEVDQATGYGIRYAFGGTNPAASSMHFLPPGSTLIVEGYPNVKSFRLIDNVVGEHAVIWATPYY